MSLTSTKEVKPDVGDARNATLGNLYGILGNPATNLQTRIGNPDAHTLASLVAKFGDHSGEVLSYTTGNLELYPLAAAYPTVNTPAVAWNWSVWAEIVPVNIIAVDFLILGATIYCVNAANAIAYDIQIGTGNAPGETPVISLSKHYALIVAGTPDIISSEYFALHVPRKVLANTRVAFRAAESGGTAKTFRCKILYIQLPI